MRLDLFVKSKYESSTVLVFDGIRYSMRDLLSDLSASEMTYIVSSGALNSTHSLTHSLSDLNNYAWPAN